MGKTKTDKEKCEENMIWFKEIWTKGEIFEEPYDGNDFETIFANYNIYWFSDFRVFYETMTSMEKHIQHPEHILPEDGYRTLAWNTSWNHADIIQEKLKRFNNLK